MRARHEKILKITHVATVIMVLIEVLTHLFVPGKPSQLVFTSPSLNHNLEHYNLTWRTDSFSPIIAYKLQFKVSKVSPYLCACNQSNFIPKVENNTNSIASQEWSEVLVPVPYIETFSSTWFYTFNFLDPGTVYDIRGQGIIKNINDETYNFTANISFSQE